MAKFKPLRIRVGTKFQSQGKAIRKAIGEVSCIHLVWDSDKEWSAHITSISDGNKSEPDQVSFKEFIGCFNAKDGFIVLPE